MTGTQNYTTILAHTILGNNNQVSESFLTVLDSFHTGTDVNDSKVEVDHELVTMNNPVHISGLNGMLVLFRCKHSQ